MTLDKYTEETYSLGPSNQAEKSYRHLYNLIVGPLAQLV